MPHPSTSRPASCATRKGTWKVIARTAEGKQFHYNVDTERDADLFAIALMAHSREIVDTDVIPA